MPWEDAAPLLMGVMVLLIPIVSILTSHQRKMAEMLHKQSTGNREGAPDWRVQELERQVAELRETVRRQAIVIDDLQAQPLVSRGAGVVNVD